MMIIHIRQLVFLALLSVMLHGCGGEEESAMSPADRFKQATRDARESSADMYEDASEAVNEAADEIGDKVADAAEEMADAGEDAYEEVREGLDDASDEVADAVEDLQED